MEIFIYAKLCLLFNMDLIKKASVKILWQSCVYLCLYVPVCVRERDREPENRS